MRLQKYLAQCGVASRRESETHILSGRVTVNGRRAEIGQQIDPEVDSIAFDGAPVGLDQKVYIVLNKPKGVVTSAKDTHERSTVLDCVPGLNARVFPVGRLDMDVSGTLLLTNDGELAFRLTHPKYEVEKTYMAWVQGDVSDESVRILREGIELDDGPTYPARVNVLKRETSSTLVRLSVHEGRKRLVKRMLSAVGHPVKELRRVSVGPIRATGLIPGEWRYLSEAEVAGLRQLTGLEDAN